MTTLDIHRILRKLPHRYPILLVDRVVELEKNQRIRALKNVTINEPYFMGHFPHRPVMPGVLMLEALAQAAAVATAMPARVEPVIDTSAGAVWEVRAAPVSRSPQTTLTTPGG